MKTKPLSSAQTAHMRLKTVMRPSTRMTSADLDDWVVDHYETMYPDQRTASIVFVDLVRQENTGHIPGYLGRQIDKASIVSGANDQRHAYIQFEYYRGGIVTIYSGDEPFDRAAFDAAMQRQQILDTTWPSY